LLLDERVFNVNDNAAGAVFGIILVCAVYGGMVLFYVQTVLGYGTAYRYTKRGGDNGVALFGWMIVFSLAAIIPGLGIYLWSKSKDKQEVPIFTETPAGWYADPSGEPNKQRYWDGQKWV
jgi:hypothetical protein